MNVYRTVSRLFSVLIETYWNVNENMRKMFGWEERRINRNILECKYYRGNHAGNFRIGINRNILECKYE